MVQRHEIHITRSGQANRAPWTALAMLLLALMLGSARDVSAQSSGTGASLWVSKNCDTCHDATPSGARANAALPDLDATNIAYAVGVLNNAITNSGSMGSYANGGSRDLVGTEKESLLLYLESVFDTSPKTKTTAFQTATNIDLGDDVVLSGTVAGITTLVTGSNLPNNGSVTYNNSLKRITYTPNNGWVGNDQFSYRARNSDDSRSTAERIVTVTTNPPPVPNINSDLSVNAKVGNFFSYTITATNSPTSYAHNTVLPPGLSRSGAVISGTPTTFDTSHITSISASNAGGTDTANLVFNVAKGDPAFTLPTQSPTTQAFRPGTTFSIDPVTNAESPATISYNVSPASNCTNSGLTVTKVSTGSCTITASQGASTNWNAPSNSLKVVTITQAIQSLSFPAQTPTTHVFVDGGTFPIDVATSTPATSSGNPIVYSSLTGLVCSVSGTTVTMESSGTCTIAANQAGNGDYAAAPQVTQNVTLTAGEPAPPTVTSAIGGDGRATIIFTPPPNPGSPVTSYTGTCTLGGGSPHTGTSPNNPVIVTGLTNGAPWSCSVTATNAIGTSIVSNTVNVSPLPSAAAAAPVFRSATTATFTIGTSSQFRIATTGVPSASPTTPSPLPSGLNAFSLLSGTRLISGPPAAGTAGTYTFSLSATNASGTANQTFRIVVVKAPQTITFPTIADRPFAPAPSTFTLNATASSGIAVSYTSLTLSICTISGNAVTMVATGMCTIRASQSGDGTWAAATSVNQSFDISPGSQTISWGTLPNKIFVANGTFPLAPLASASSSLPITAYTSLLPGNCTVSGTTVTMLQVGACNIEASQDGDANYQPAPDFIRGFAINKASQTITFPAQAAQPFVDGGTFPINPLATGGLSGNPIVYSGQTPAICTLADTTVTIVTLGTCTIAANQAGNNNYNPAMQVTANISINAVAPSAPTAQAATPGDASATVPFLPPNSDGGSPLIDYRVTCNPGNFTATADSSPIRVTGFANGVTRNCTVAARNAVGFGPESNSVGVTPFLETGANLWANKCSGCHGADPSAARFNAAGETGTVLNYVRANQPSMEADSAVQALTANELSEIAKYIKSFVPAINVSTDYVTPKLIDVGLPNHLYLGGVAFTHAEVVTPPTNGTLSAFTGTTITYTPNAGFAGTDTFTYRGRRTSPQSVSGEARTVTIMVNTPAAPLVTSGNTANGVFNQAFSYQITATNSPASFGASGLPPGVSVNTANGLVNGTATAAGVFNAMVNATNPGGTGQLAVTMTISAANQTISFGAQGAQSFAPNGTFAISPATATSNLAVTYSSLTPAICSVSGSTVTMLTAGTCTLAADQGGNTNFNAALQVTQNVAIGATVPGAPTIGAATPGNTTATIAFTQPANNGGSPITQYNATCTPSGAGSNTVSPITITGLTNNTQYTCSVTATNAAGPGPASGNVLVTPVATNVSPQFTSATSTSFTVLTSNNFNVTASGTPAPALTLQSGTPPAGVTFVNGLLSGTPASGTVAGSPYNLVFLADGHNPDATQNFTLTVAKRNQTITFNNPGAQNFSPSTIGLTATSSLGLTVTLTSNTPAVCTLSGFNLTTVATGVCSITATQVGNSDVNAANNITNGFSVNPASQSITFGGQGPPRNFSAVPFPLSPVAFATSALPIAYSTTTPSVCTASGTSITTLTAGTCTIAANQGGNANYAAAIQVTQSVTINAVVPGAPTIGAATGSDLQASIAFTAPSSNGGSPITQYTATCSPSGSGSGNTSPVVVTGLTNGQSYTCSVTATNQAGLTGATSGNVNVTPTSANGAALWGSVCTGCHSQTPSGNQLNGAGSTATVLQHVRTTQSLMAIFGPVQNLSQADLAAIAVYIRDQLPANNPSTPQNTALPINVASHVTFTNQVWSAFTSVEVVTPPTKGTLSVFTGTTATYTPNNGESGTDSFTYRGRRSSPTVIGDAIQVTITVQPGAPAITSAPTASGTFNTAFSYQITASGSPTSFGATGLPAGFNVDAAGLITGTPGASGLTNATISATNAGGTTNANLAITINPATQSINFPAQITGTRNFVFGGSFTVDPVATGGVSGEPVTYGSSTTNVCTVNGTNVSFVAAGTCTITADQAGNANYASAPQVSQGVAINAVAAAAPTIGAATPGNMSAQIAFTAPNNTGGANITSYNVSCTPNGTASGSMSPVTVNGLTNGVTYACTVAAVNSAGAGAVSQSVNVTPQQITVPDAPVIGVPIALNAAASISFTQPVNNGGSAILNYTATCNPGTFSNTAAASPIVVSGLTNGVTYGCSVIATNAMGPSVPSSSMDVTPFAPIALDRVVSRKLHGVVVGEVTLNSEPVTGNVAVEPRLSTNGHQIVFVFTGDAGGIPGTVNVTDALGMAYGAVGATAVANGSEVIVTLTNVPENTRLKVSLTNVAGSNIDASAALGFLVGDVNGSRSVNASDISAVKANLSLPATIARFRMDFNVDGTITSADVSTVKSRSGAVLAP